MKANPSYPCLIANYPPGKGGPGWPKLIDSRKNSLFKMGNSVICVCECVCNVYVYMFVCA